MVHDARKQCRMKCTAQRIGFAIPSVYPIQGGMGALLPDLCVMRESRAHYHACFTKGQNAY